MAIVASAGCAAPVSTEADRAACIEAGHTPGTQAFEDCLQDLQTRRFERAPGATVDDLRTRMDLR